jgi:parallel beta-helix repeat protein
VTKPLSFRSIQDAMTAARDGDRIVIQLGQHNVGGAAVDVNKRVLIRGEGQLGDTVLEQRANAPLFRLLAPAVVQNLVLDLCGFRECISCEGSARCTPLLESCTIKCSGDHAVVCVGASAPTLRACDVSARKAGLLLLGTSRPCVQDCTLSGCEQQGVRAAESSWPRLERCRITGNGAEGVVAMDSAGVELADCTLTGNKGPGVDVSGAAHVALSACRVADNAGGLFLWDKSSAALQRVSLSGGAHHALLADAHTRPRAHDCTIAGDVLALSDAAGAGVTATAHGNKLSPAPASRRATLPAEAGCFKFEADRFTRKQ